MIGGLSAKLHATVRELDLYALGSGGQRFAAWLLRAVPTDEHAAAVTLPAAKRAVASRLNLSRAPVADPAPAERERSYPGGRTQGRNPGRCAAARLERRILSTVKVSAARTNARALVRVLTIKALFSRPTMKFANCSHSRRAGTRLELRPAHPRHPGRTRRIRGARAGHG